MIFFFKQKPAYEILSGLVGSEKCIRDRGWTRHGVITDSAAKYTETFLHAMGINYYLLETDDDATRISIAFEEARKNSCPVAVLVGDEYHGFNRM